MSAIHRRALSPPPAHVFPGRRLWLRIRRGMEAAGQVLAQEFVELRKDMSEARRAVGGGWWSDLQDTWPEEDFKANEDTSGGWWLTGPIDRPVRSIEAVGSRGPQRV